MSNTKRTTMIFWGIWKVGFSSSDLVWIGKELADCFLLIDLHWSEEDQMYCDASIDAWGMYSLSHLSETIG